jgi:Winged helix-turn helix
MRGRKPHVLQMALDDKPRLQQIAHSQTRPWYQVQHARIVLAMAVGERVQTVVSQLPCDPSTVWRVCRRYEQAGLAGVLKRMPRTGRSLRISPPATGTDGSAGLS